jgi:O-antigen/teichoic acid export membrane protein
VRARCREAEAKPVKRHLTRLSAASLSPFGEFLLRFVRTVIVSRLLSPDDLGAAVALMAILTGCEVITDVGLDKFVMVSRPDARAQVVAVARQIAIGRAVLLAVVIALGAPLLAAAFGAGGEHRIVAWLGVVPLIASLRNWRVVQVQQEYRYGAETISNLGSRVIALLVLFPAYLVFRDERVVVANLIVEAILAVVLSYVLAPRGGQVAKVDPVLRRQALRFGLPLMANGVGLVVMKQLDQMIVANLFDLAVLAHYALVLNLAIMPTSVLQRVASRVFLPFLGKARAQLASAERASFTVVVGMTAAGAAFAVPIGLTLDWLAPLVYGRQYQVTPAFAALAMLVAFLRFARGGPNTVMVEHGQTVRLTAGNLIAGIGMAIGFALGVHYRRVEAVLVGVLIGDLLSFVLLVWLMRRLLPMAESLRHFAVLGVAVAAVAAAVWLEDGAPWMQRGAILAGAMLVIGIDSYAIYRWIAGADARPFAARRGKADKMPGSPTPAFAEQAAGGER